MNWFALVWLVLLVIFIMAEASTVTVVSLWFAVGALSAMVAALLGAELWLQATLFAVVSVILLCSLRPIVRKYFTPKLTKTNVDALVGTTGRVTEKIDNTLSQGRVKLGAMEWSARSTAGETVEEGTLVRVDRIEGVKVFVTTADVTAQVK